MPSLHVKIRIRVTKLEILCFSSPLDDQQEVPSSCRVVASSILLRELLLGAACVEPNPK
jgi:hypothetical protein